MKPSAEFYNTYKWKICRDLKLKEILLGLQIRCVFSVCGPIVKLMNILQIVKYLPCIAQKSPLGLEMKMRIYLKAINPDGEVFE